LLDIQYGQLSGRKSQSEGGNSFDIFVSPLDRERAGERDELRIAHPSRVSAIVRAVEVRASLTF
jgi:hypothetical protein